MAKLQCLLLFCLAVSLPLGRANTLEETIASVVKEYASDPDKMDILSNLAGNMDNLKGLISMFGQPSEGKADNSALNMLAGLGSLLGGQNGQFDPSAMGSMLSMLGQSLGQTQPREKRETNKDNDINFDGLIGLASSFLGGQNQGSAVPMIMNALGSMLADPDKRAVEHKDHAGFLPPFVEKLHVYWDLFMNSELGKTIYEKSGLKKGLKMFTGDDGKLSFGLMLQKFENQSFRRHWIKAASKYLTDMIMYIAKPEVLQRYMTSGQFMLNSFLEAQGMPKSTYFNIKTPEKSITALINHVMRNYMDMNTDVTDYVNAAVAYLKKTMTMAELASKKLASRSDYNAVTDRMTDTLNLEVIEPVMRVYRAYKHSLKAPHCAQHLMCLVNKHGEEKQGLPGFKVALTKLSSLAASAAISYQSGKGFWELYQSVTTDRNCEDAYPADCNAFHEHELKVTTEVYHSEL